MTERNLMIQKDLPIIKIRVYERSILYGKRIRLRAVLEILHCGDLEVWPPESIVILLLNS